MMNRKANILMVTEAFYPDGIGGAHTYVYGLSRELIKAGHNVYVMTIKTGTAFSSEEDIEGIKLYRYRTALSGPLLFIRHPLESIINSWFLFRKLSKIVKFDVINFHLTLPAFGVNHCSSSRDIRKIYTFHSSMSEEVRLQIKKKKYFPRILDALAISVIKWLERDNLNRCRKIVVLSTFSKKCLIGSYGQSEEKIVLIPGGVDVEKFTPAKNQDAKRAELSLPLKKVIFLTARRLVTRMGLENLICAVKDVTEKEKDVLLLILGEGFLRGRLEGLIESKGLNGTVVLKGFVDTGKMPGYYQACDAFIVPSEYDEWFGLVSIEALACGVPVLGTPIGGTSEILSQIDPSLLFKGTEPRDMTEGMLNFIKNRETLVKRSIEFRDYTVKNYSWGGVREKTEGLYLEEISNVK